MAIRAIDSGFQTINTLPAIVWVAFSCWLKVENSASANKQTIFYSPGVVAGNDAKLYVQSGKLYYEDVTTKGGTQGKWSWDIGDGYYHLIFIHLSGFDTSPIIQFNAVAQTRTLITTPVDSAFFQETSWNFLGSPGTKHMNLDVFEGTIEEIAIWKITLAEGQGITNTNKKSLASGIKRLPLQLLRRTPAGVDNLLFYAPCDEIPHGVNYILGTEEDSTITVTSDVAQTWRLGGGAITSNEAISEISTTKYISAGETSDNLIDITGYDNHALVGRRGVVAIMNTMHGYTGSAGAPISAIWAGGVVQTYESIISATAKTIYSVYIKGNGVISQSDLNSMQFKIAAPATIDKGETGGTLFWQKATIFQSDYTLHDLSARRNELVSISGKGERGRLVYPE